MGGEGMSPRISTTNQVIKVFLKINYKIQDGQLEIHIANTGDKDNILFVKISTFVTYNQKRELGKLKLRCHLLA